ncbi:hypothetical protein B0T24DRAFT_666528 [Lasiosphaeria ovina]|uniref:Uncharacterized protein n=1 Tax=Lasiosphaeria ovina TaxID=92902 RepID=A0AAE0KC59_9PEZI|nr:hypothetical protein B0T24DRAFT_666528 [Lasiosphaeria ovina]
MASQILARDLGGNGGGFFIDIKDPENLPESLIQRLRDFGKTAKTYSEAAEDLLGHYGYHELPLPIQYHEDPGQQDQVTTWLEYLAYEYALHYRHRLLIKNGRSKHDQEWKKLVHSNVLRPLETEEHIRSHKSAHECDRDKDRTYDRVVSAKSIMEKAPEWHQNSPTSPAGHQSTKQAEEVRLANAKSRLNEAEKLLELVKRRDKLITEFMRAVGDYYSQKRDAVRTGLRAVPSPRLGVKAPLKIVAERGRGEM